METPKFQFDESTMMSFVLIILAFYVGRQLPRWMAGVPYVKPDEAKAQLDGDPDILVIDVRVVCKTDQLSARAARILRKNGLTKVAVLAGGLKAWKKAGQPVTVA